MDPEDKPKCTCVPSGRCHSHTLLGCPHQHYFNDKRVWTCVNKEKNQCWKCGRYVNVGETHNCYKRE
jgi:hypothetical protein